MQPKKLMPMAVVLVALIIVGLIVKREKPERTLEEQANLVAVCPDSVQAGSVTALEFALGGKESSVRLVKDGANWKVASAWDAPATAEKIEKLIKDVTEMQGERKSANAKVHADYKLLEDKALRIKLFTAASADKPAFELLVGKKLDQESDFVRQLGSDTVYLVDKNLRSELGLWGDGEKEPERGPWLEKKILSLDKDKVASISRAYPDHALIVTKEEKDSGKKEDGKEGEDKAPAKKEYEWKLVSGGPGGEYKKAEFNTILSSVSLLNIEDVADPSKLKEYGLDEAPYRCTVTLEDGSSSEILASRKRGKSDVYVMLGDNDKLIYVMRKWSFDRLFAKSSELFALENPKLEKDKVLSLSLKAGEKTVKFSRKDSKSNWTLQGAGSAFPIDKAAVDSVLATLSVWKFEDYGDAEGMVKYGLSLPQCTVEAELEGGKKWTLILGLEHPVYDGAYVAAGPKAQVFVMAQSDVDKAFPSFDKLFVLDPLFPKDAKGVESVSFSRASKPAWDLKKAEVDEGENKLVVWKVVAQGKSTEADATKVAAYIKNLGMIGAAGFYEGDIAKAFEAGKTDKLSFTGKGGVLELELGAKLDSVRVARVGGRPDVFLIDNKTVEDLLVDAKIFEAEKKEPEPKKESKASGKKAEAGAVEAEKTEAAKAPAKKEK